MRRVLVILVLAAILGSGVAVLDVGAEGISREEAEKLARPIARACGGEPGRVACELQGGRWFCKDGDTNLLDFPDGDHPEVSTIC